MVEFIEGEWKNFVFKMAKPEDFPKVLQHMRSSFYVDEPLNKAIQYDEEDQKEMDKSILEVLDKGISFMALDKTTGDVRIHIKQTLRNRCNLTGSSHVHLKK